MDAIKAGKTLRQQLMEEAIERDIAMRIPGKLTSPTARQLAGSRLIQSRGMPLKDLIASEEAMVRAYTEIVTILKAVDAAESK